jgi:hypothetical protein
MSEKSSLGMVTFCIVFISTAVHDKATDHWFNDSTSFLAHLLQVIGTLLHVDHRSVFFGGLPGRASYVLALLALVSIVVRHIISYLGSQNPPFVARQLQIQS